MKIPTSIFLITLLFSVTANVHASSIEAELKKKEIQERKKEIQERKKEIELTTLQSAVAAYRLNADTALERQKLETEKQLREMREKYEVLVAEKNSLLSSQKKELNTYKKQQYKPVNIQYTGGERLKRWTLPNRTSKP